MLKDFTDGIVSYARAWRIIVDNKMWYYVLMPGLISLILGGSIGYSAYLLHSDVTNYITTTYPEQWYGYSLMARIANYLSWFVLGVIGFLTYRNILMALLAPFMSPLSARVQAIETGETVFDPPFLSLTNFKLILRGLVLSFRNLIKELWYTLWLLVLGFIPIIGLIAPILIFLVQSFYAGFSNLDYTLEKYYNVKNSKAFSRDHRWLAVGNGSVFLLLLTVPVLGLFLAPALSTVAATLETVKRVDTPLKNLKVGDDFI
jgi:CysZ protein